MVGGDEDRNWPDVALTGTDPHHRFCDDRPRRCQSVEVGGCTGQDYWLGLLIEDYFPNVRNVL